MKLKELFYIAVSCDSDFVNFVNTIAVRSGYKLPLSDEQRDKILSLRLGNTIHLDDDARGERQQALFEYNQKLKEKNKLKDSLFGPA